MPGPRERAAAFYKMGKDTIREARKKDRLDAEKREQEYTLAKLALDGLRNQLHNMERGFTKTTNAPLFRFVLDNWNKIATLPRKAAYTYIWTLIEHLPNARQRVLLPDVPEQRTEMKRRVRRAYNAVAKKSHF